MVFFNDNVVIIGVNVALNSVVFMAAIVFAGDELMSQVPAVRQVTYYVVLAPPSPPLPLPLPPPTPPPPASFFRSFPSK